MSFTELKDWLRDHLHMRGDSAAQISLRNDEAPYEMPAALWKFSRDDFRNNFIRSVMELTSEAGMQPWKPQAFHELAQLIEATHLWEAVRSLEGITQTRRLLRDQDGAVLCMIALRTLLALGWKGTTDFWLAQMKLVGSVWPEIIFVGLAQQDLDLAFNHLPHLVNSRDAMSKVLDVFPGLMRDLKLGILTLREKSNRIFERLPPDAQEAMRQWFRLRDYPLSNVATFTNLSLREGICILLPNDSEPRYYTPMLSAVNFFKIAAV